MHFKGECVNDFMDLFNEAYPKITAMPGCQSLQLLVDINTPEILFTYSHWENDAALQNYRNSELFSGTWARTKILFAEKAEAWSVETITSRIRSGI